MALKANRMRENSPRIQGAGGSTLHYLVHLCLIVGFAIYASNVSGAQQDGGSQQDNGPQVKQLLDAWQKRESAIVTAEVHWQEDRFHPAGTLLQKPRKPGGIQITAQPDARTTVECSC